MPINRRQAIQNAFAAAVAAYAASRQPASAAPPTVAPPTPPVTVPTTTPAVIDVGPGPFTLPPLPYAYDALEPYIDKQTMILHHDKHHATYVKNLNTAIQPYPDLQKKTVEEILKNLDAVPEAIRTKVKNNAGGHYNHSLFWQTLSKSGGQPSEALGAAVIKQLGSAESVQLLFAKTALDIFGSGWAWLTIAPDGALKIEATEKQDSPLSQGRLPLIGLDVWEHAYYLKYQNKRADYLAAVINVINWDFINARFENYKKLI